MNVFYRLFLIIIALILLIGLPSSPAHSQPSLIDITQYNSDAEHFANCSAKKKSFGEGSDENALASINTLLERAAKGDIEAAYFLALKHHIGLEVTSNIDRAIELYKFPAESGHLGAIVNYGKLLESKFRNSPNSNEYKISLRYISEGARCGDGESQYLIGKYLINMGSRESITAGIYWLNRSSNQRNNDADKTLGQLYIDGVVVKKDVFKATSYWLNLSPAYPTPGMLNREKILANELKSIVPPKITFQIEK